MINECFACSSLLESADSLPSFLFGPPSRSSLMSLGFSRGAGVSERGSRAGLVPPLRVTVLVRVSALRGHSCGVIHFLCVPTRGAALPGWPSSFRTGSAFLQQAWVLFRRRRDWLWNSDEEIVLASRWKRPLSCLCGDAQNGLHLYSAFIQRSVQFMPLIHPFTHTFTHQRRLAAMQGTDQLVRSNWGLGVLLGDTSTRPGWDRTGNPPTARRQLLPPEPYRPTNVWTHWYKFSSGKSAD